MGATVDLNLVSKKNINLEKIINLLTGKFELNVKINNIDIMDNWEYDNVINILEIDKAEKYIEESKIANIELRISDKWNAGCQIEKIGNIYVTNIWIDTAKINCLDCDIINEENNFFYEEVTNLVLDSVKEYDIVISSLGVETTFEYNEDIYEIINTSQNVIIWIITGNYPENINNYYLQEQCKLDVGIFIKACDK
jgi:hypothetical protein